LDWTWADSRQVDSVTIEGLLAFSPSRTVVCIAPMGFTQRRWN
jgi:hypothetical protein